MTEIIRPAGYNERRCISRDTLGLYGYIVTLATYSGPNPPTETIITKAVEECVAQHAVLSTVIQQVQTEQPQLAKAASIDLTRHLHFVDPSSQDRASQSTTQYLLERVHNEPFTRWETIPQWHVWILRTPDSSTFQVAFAISHALTDGMSGFVFHRSFLDAICSGPSTGNTATPTTNELLPALDQAAALLISWSFLLRPLLSEFLPGFLTRAIGLADGAASEAWRGSQQRPERSTSIALIPTAVEILSIPQADIQRALKVAKENKSRLTGLLNYLTARALSYALQNRGQTYSKFIVATAIDLRKHIPEGRDRMANYVSGVEEALHVGVMVEPNAPLNAEEWQAIQQSTEKLSKASSTLSDQPVSLLKYLSDFRKWVSKRASEPAKASFGMSNLGVFVDDRSSETTQPYTITDMCFSQSADGTGEPLNINVASVKDGELSITLTWWPGMLGVDDERGFAIETLATVAAQIRAIGRK